MRVVMFSLLLIANRKAHGVGFLQNLDLVSCALKLVSCLFLRVPWKYKRPVMNFLRFQKGVKWPSQQLQHFGARGVHGGRTVSKQVDSSVLPTQPNAAEGPSPSPSVESCFC